MTRRLPLNIIHVWCVNLRLKALVGRAENFQLLLSSDEVSRANLIEAEISRTEFIVNRGILRIILATYLGVEPRNVKFKYNENQKPSLSPAPDSPLYSSKVFGHEGIQFNLAHSHGLAVYAICSRYRIGADLEWMNRSIEDASGRYSIVDRFFSTDERNSLSKLRGDAKRRMAFFKLWTAKEAFLKVRGENIGAITSKDGTVDFGLVLRKRRGIIHYRRASKDQSFSFWQFEPRNHFISTVVREGSSRAKLQLRKLITEKQAEAWAFDFLELDSSDLSNKCFHFS